MCMKARRQRTPDTCRNGPQTSCPETKGNLHKGKLSRNLGLEKEAFLAPGARSLGLPPGVVARGIRRLYGVTLDEPLLHGSLSVRSDGATCLWGEGETRK